MRKIVNPRVGSSILSLATTKKPRFVRGFIVGVLYAQLDLNR